MKRQMDRSKKNVSLWFLLISFFHGETHCEFVQSSPVDVISSVLQGTVIGPLSFLVFINDLPNYISEGTKTRLFADDAFVYREISPRC